MAKQKDANEITGKLHQLQLEHKLISDKVQDALQQTLIMAKSHDIPDKTLLKKLHSSVNKQIKVKDASIQKKEKRSNEARTARMNEFFSQMSYNQNSKYFAI